MNENIFSEINQNEIMCEKTSLYKRNVSVWIAVLCVILAIVVTFMTTFVILNDNYRASINIIKKEYNDELSSYQNAVDKVSSNLEGIEDLFKEISILFEMNYIYDVNYDELIKNIIKDYAAETGDRYAYYYTAEEWANEIDVGKGNSCGIGIYIAARFQDNLQNIDGGLFVTHVMEDGPADLAGLKKGDHIVAVNGTVLDGMLYDDALDLTAGEKGTTVILTIVRDDTEIEIPVVRDQYKIQTVLYDIIEEKGKKIGLIHITQFVEVTVQQFKDTVKTAIKDGCDGIIFDVRGNPGGYLDAIIEILDYLLPSGPIVSVSDNNGIITKYDSDASGIDNIEVVVLADGSTASAAELFASALKDYKYADIIGEKTYGKGCGQTIYPLSNGGYLKLTSFLYNPPFSENYDGIGVIPDIEVSLDEEYRNQNVLLLERDQDKQLEAAIQNILNKLK